MNDREWQTADNAGSGEESGEKKDSFFRNEDEWWEEKAPAENGFATDGSSENHSAENPSPDGGQNTGENRSGYAGEGADPYRNDGPYQGSGRSQNAGQYQNNGSYQGGAQYQNAGQYQGSAQYQNNGPYQSSAQYQNADPHRNDGPYQNGNPGYFPHSPYQGAPLRPDGRVDGPEDPVKVSEWLITMLVLAIPCVNLIMLFVWGFGGSEKRSKSNYCKASLIWMAICCGIFILFYIVVIAGIVAGIS